MEIELISRRAAHGAALLAKSLEIALASVELSLSQYRLLVLLSDSPSAATALADRLDVTRPSLTALVDGLVTRGFVVREPDAHDRRRVSHQISPSGHDALARADTAVQERLSGLAGHLDPVDRPTAATGLEHWLDAIITARAARVSR
ncbi:MAG: MarR family winged helix-turn-helix transcriptional regulator [Acidimicrobiales bacterium]